MTLVGYAPGAFDMFHIGHLNILERARSACDHLIAGVATDEVVWKMKAKMPVVPFADRLAIVQSIQHVDDAVADPFTDKFDAWQQLEYDVLFKGDDWQATARGADLEMRLAEVGARVVYFPYTQHTSSSALRGRIATGSENRIGDAKTA